MPRTIAIGDIHGCLSALNRVLTAINLSPDDTIVTLGDYVDRGHDSKGVLDRLISLSRQCRLVPILGNHDEMMLRAKDDDEYFSGWIGIGGQKALDSYGANGELNLGVVPERHFQFLASCQSYYETETHFFVHANYLPEVPLNELDEDTLRWLSLRTYVPPKPHRSGKIAVVGHTPQPDVLDLGYLVCVDTGCANGGKLTAIDVHARTKWQADEIG